MSSVIQFNIKDGSSSLSEYLALAKEQSRAGLEAPPAREEQPGAAGAVLPETDTVSISARAQELAERAEEAEAAEAGDEAAAKGAWLGILEGRMSKTESESGGSMMAEAIRKRVKAMIKATQATLERERQHEEQRDEHQEALKAINAETESSAREARLEKTGRKAVAYNGIGQAALLRAGRASISRNL